MHRQINTRVGEVSHTSNTGYMALRRRAHLQVRVRANVSVSNSHERGVGPVDGGARALTRVLFSRAMRRPAPVYGRLVLRNCGREVRVRANAVERRPGVLSVSLVRGNLRAQRV
jgi:hypothetical protein